VHLTDFLDPRAAERLERDFPPLTDAGWTNYEHYNVKKHGRANRASFPESIRDAVDHLNSPEFLSFLSRLTGIEGLIADPDLEGAGLHQSEGGDYLHIHADFTMHSHRANWRRRLNLLLYLNRDWQPEWNGQLELWNRDVSQKVQVYSPLLNHCVIFGTHDHSFHGHPEPLRCPPERTRKSIALYYYTVDESHERAHATHYLARPDDPLWKRTMIRLDGLVLAGYYRLKRRFGFDDRIASAVLHALRRRK
jgi:hypothetical protein